MPGYSTKPWLPAEFYSLDIPFGEHADRIQENPFEPIGTHDGGSFHIGCVTAGKILQNFRASLV